TAADVSREHGRDRRGEADARGRVRGQQPDGEALERVQPAEARRGSAHEVPQPDPGRADLRRGNGGPGPGPGAGARAEPGCGSGAEPGGGSGTEPGAEAGRNRGAVGSG